MAACSPIASSIDLPRSRVTWNLRSQSCGRAGDKSKGQSLNLVASGDTADRPEAVVSGDLEFGTVKIPISLITGWIQTPMRTLLGVRVVTGSVQKEGGGYLLLAQSSDGGTFRVRSARPRLCRCPRSRQEGDGDKPTDGPPAFDRTIAANSLADELAYKLISTVPEMANAGMTQAWQAVEPVLQRTREVEAVPDGP